MTDYDIVARIRQALRENVDPHTLANGGRVFKEEIKPYGVKVPECNRIALRFYKELKNEPKEKVFEVCETLWRSGYLEEGFIACNFAYAKRKEYTPEDMEVFERWVGNYISNWATCDTLCNHTVGDFVMMYPEFVDRLKEWAHSPNRWMRRAAAVTLIIPARKGMFLDEIFEIAATLLTDPDDLVQKGYGWMLKAASQAHLDEVFGFVMANKAAMPRTALRYAIEKMPAHMKAEAMRK